MTNKVSTKKILELHATNAPRSKVAPIFGSHVGNHLSDSNKQDFTELLILELELFPYLHETGPYKRLHQHNPTQWPINNDHAFEHTNEAACGMRPGTGTERALGEDLPSTDPSDPIAVQVSKKLVQLHKSAKKRNKEFNLTHEDVAALLSAERCHYTDELLETSGLQQRTIDRIDNSQGYVQGNVVACTYQVNQLKAFLFEDVRSELFMTYETLLKVMLRTKMDRMEMEQDD